MYEAYFGLHERPFSIAPDPRYLYLSDHHREALAHLLYGIGERGGFVQLTGEVGTGKTTLTRALLDQLPPDVDVALILNPNVTVREFLVAICDELGVSLPKRSHSAQALVDELMRYLLDAYGRGRHTVVLVDEAQNLSTMVLEQVRLLTNLETTKEKLLQIILVGQPELRELLARPDLRQVSQRITARYHLAPLSYRQTRDYVEHRTQVAGAARPLFSRPAIMAVHRLSRGIPRLINVICDRALLGAYGGGRGQVDLPTVLRAAREVRGAAPRGWVRWAAGLALLATLLGGGAWLATPPPSSVPLAAAEESARQADSLENRLAGGRWRTDLHTAFEGLFRLWGSFYRAGSPLTPCEQAAEAKLNCHYQAGDWEELARRNLPALIELRDDAGLKHRAVLVGLREDRVVLQFGGEREEFAAAEVRARWTGDSIALWRAPVGALPLRPGSAGADVLWLARQLDRIEGRPGVTSSDRYDAALEQRVRAFQQQHALSPDGIVGENTLMHLIAAAATPGLPQLAGN